MCLRRILECFERAEKQAGLSLSAWPSINTSGVKTAIYLCRWADHDRCLRLMRKLTALEAAHLHTSKHTHFNAAMQQRLNFPLIDSSLLLFRSEKLDVTHRSRYAPRTSRVCSSFSKRRMEMPHHTLYVCLHRVFQVVGAHALKFPDVCSSAPLVAFVRLSKRRDGCISFSSAARDSMCCVRAYYASKALENGRDNKTHIARESEFLSSF